MVVEEIIKGKGDRTFDIDKLSPKTRTFYKKLKGNLQKHYGLNLDDYLTSMYRTPEEDKKVGGTGKGRHTTGEGIDIATGDNPIIYNYLWHTEEGLKLLADADLGVYDETSGNTGTGKHYHIGADTYGEEKDNNKKGVVKGESRLKNKKTKNIAFLTPVEVAQANPDYINPEKIKELVDKEVLTPEEVNLNQKFRAAQDKFTAFEKAKSDYEKATDPITGGNKDEIKKTKDVYQKAYAEAHDIIAPLRQQKIIKERERLENIVNTTEPGYPNHDKAQTELTLLLQNEYDEKVKFEKVKKGRRNGTKKSVSYKIKPLRSGQEIINQKNKQKKRRGENLIKENIDEILLKEFDELNTSIKTSKEERETAPEYIEKIKEATVKRRKENQDVQIKINKLKEKGVAQSEYPNIQKNIEQAQAEIDEQTRLDSIEAEKKRKEATDAFSRFNEPEELLTPPNVFDYNKADYKRQLPLEALGYGALALSGLEDAKTELPLRDEQYSQALLQYTQDLKRLSEQGLKPEQEAKMKDDLSGAYAEGINQLVRSSGGNRNLVLGNQQSLQNSRMRGITDIGLADAMIKQENFEKYGNALKEMQSFRVNREIANHQIKLDEAKAKQQGGAALANTGFATMLEEIQYQKENGPGSANHRLRKAYEIMITGVDSERPDDGGPFTPSGVRAQNEARIKASENEMSNYNTEKNLYNRYMDLPADGSLPSFEKWKQEQQAPAESDIPEIIKTNQAKGGFSSFGW